MRTTRSLVCAVVVLTTLAGAALAAPPPRWRNDGNPVGAAPGRQHAPLAMTDGGTGAIVLWRDERRGPGLTDLYAQRVLPNGAVGWAANGVPVIEGLGVSSLAATPDGAGGALLLTLEAGTLRARRLLADGTMGGDPAGRVLATAIGGPSGTGFAACPDGEGGAYAAFFTFDFTSERLKLLRVDRDGAIVPGWDPPLEVWAHAWDFGGYAGYALASGPAGGVIVAFSVRWERLIGADYLGYARRYGGDAALGWASVLNAALAADAVASPELVADLSDGAYLRIAGGATYHLDGTGASTWPTSPAVVTSGRLAFDFDGGLYATASAGPSPVVHRLDTAGALPPGWTAGGVPIASSADLSSLDVEPYPGGLMLAWSDVPAGDIRVGAVAAGGAIAAGWGDAGTLACRVRGTQTQPTLVPLSATDGFVAWTDTRRDDGDVYANVVGPGAGGGPRAALEGASAAVIAPAPAAPARLAVSGAPDRPRLSGQLPAPGTARVELIDLAGRVVHAESFEAGAGAFSRPIEAPGLRRGVYWARVTQGRHVETTRFVRLR